MGLQKSLRGPRAVTRLTVYRAPQVASTGLSLMSGYELGKKFNVVTNIRRAEVSDSEGWVVLELESEQKEIDRAIKWTIDQGVHVTILEGDFIEG